MRADPRALLPFALVAAGCARESSQPPAPAPLPSLAVEQVVSQLAPPARRVPRGTSGDPLDGLPAGPPVSLSAAGVDVRTLLPALAEAAGISLVLGADVQGRVSVNLVEVPALEALRAVLAEAKLSLAAGPVTPPFLPVVFYILPVDIEEASVEAIMARFDVSAELARWIVANRPK